MQGHSSPTNFYEEYTLSIGLTEPKQRQVDLHSFIKRALDVIFSILCLPLILIITITFCILIKIETKGPVFYFQERVGLYGHYFKICKLRSMYIDAERDGAKWAIENDPRITKVGRFMRRARIDELPQIINVLKGEMTLIGPRPERPMFTAKFEKTCPGFINRLQVKPGLTGFAQINGGYNIPPEEKLKLDLYYIENKGILLDLKILIQTIRIVFSGDGAR